MARYITISCLGPRPLVVPKDVPPQETVERMMEHWRSQLERVLPDGPDLIVLPEACDRPDKVHYPQQQRMNYYRTRGSQIREFFSRIAREHRCYIAYASHTEAADGSWRNAVQLIGRDGVVEGIYHKNHLVPDEYYKDGILYGKAAPVFDCDFGKVACAICFDLNFDELREQFVREKPDVIVFPSMYHGGIMQNYWAYSCRAYFAGAVAGLPCTVVSPLGEEIARSTNYYPFITARVNLDCEVLHIDRNGAKFSEMKLKYGTDIRIHDPGFLGSVLLTSESESVSVKEIIEEYGLERLDDYFGRALAERHAPGHIEL
ncbi:carbon-nitrogen hydrolase family protein [Paenibacillus sp. J5C_2022]|uniref:carbon-nitrogen hydrolase family protein n=1 Tax=Paenibacillus sp. J5C2022 TaxID=2977129 RepID=UPI0021CF433B|nr:carbon-nitrogen hydrolase family protein [Paenibacillus sp. J5C2022]MCU6708378.1 carbon-nitrogen hydrolase family protein [Paenibacillus sp. J5C2022]